jgi:hypothetical protein
MKNASKIGTITFGQALSRGTVTAAQLGVLGAKFLDGKVILTDTADNLLSSSAKANYTDVAAKVGAINVTKATLAQVGQLNTAITVDTTYATTKIGDIAISDSMEKLTASAGANITTAIGLVNALHGGTGTVSKITIEGNGSLVKKTDLDTIKSLALDGASAAINVAYSGKALDIQKNLGALVENISGATPANRLNQITVTDGSYASKKQFNMTYSQYGTVQGAFTAGQVSSTNSNYGYILSAVTTNNAGLGAAQTMQANEKVSSFSVTGVSAVAAKDKDVLTTLLGYSKLKTATIASGISSDDIALSRTALSRVASNVDRAKLKYIA